jgi:hypothetical protein
MTAASRDTRNARAGVQTSYAELRAEDDLERLRLRIYAISFQPPMAIGRFGGSDTPLDNYTWKSEPDVFGAARTVVTPSVTLVVAENGKVYPTIPAAIRFRDGALLRPVAPFFELWGKVGIDGRPPQEAGEMALNLWILDRAGVEVDNLTYSLTVANRKAARRTGDPSCAYEAQLTVKGYDYRRQELLAYSPPQPGREPLVLKEHPIRLGWFQVIRPVGLAAMGVDCSVLRVRFTPGEGKVYGPPTAVTGSAPDTGRVHVVVPEENRILNPRSTWARYNSDFGTYDNPDPFNTYDGADVADNRSWGVVDDSCDGVLEAALVVNGERLSAVARVFTGPPHYAPDRRFFLSLADELVDRENPLDERPVTGDSFDTAKAEVVDLFARVAETASLINLPAVRAFTLADNEDLTLPARVKDLPRTDPDESMMPADAPFADQVLPYIREVGDFPPVMVSYFLIQQVHGRLADEDILLDFLATEAERVRRLLRPPYGPFKKLKARPGRPGLKDCRDPRIDRDLAMDMRMPPYMYDSDSTPLSLSVRQYHLVMGLVDELEERRQEAAKQLKLKKRLVGKANRLIREAPQSPLMEKELLSDGLMLDLLLHPEILGGGAPVQETLKKWGKAQAEGDRAGMESCRKVLVDRLVQSPALRGRLIEHYATRLYMKR